MKTFKFGFSVKDVLGNYDALYNQGLVGENEPSKIICEQILKKALRNTEARLINASIREQLIERKNEY